MILKNRYCCGVHVMWYEFKMFPEYIESCHQMLLEVENRENVTFHFCFNLQEYLEKIDWDKMHEIYGYDLPYKFRSVETRPAHDSDFRNFWWNLFEKIWGNGLFWGKGQPLAKVRVDIKTDNDEFYNIADYRRDLNNDWCRKTEYVMWGETDSLWPKETLEVVESISQIAENSPKHVISFADRKMWDSSWDKLCHPLFESQQFQDNDNWTLNNEASGKSYMTLDRMNEINSKSDGVEIHTFNEPKFDGSCLVISSELIKSGVNIPHSLLLAGEDTAFMEMCKTVLGNNYVQYHVKNILHVHNRRHPNKRTGILNETNPNGFCDDRKGKWWIDLENASKFNLANLKTQVKFKTINTIL